MEWQLGQTQGWWEEGRGLDLLGKGSQGLGDFRTPTTPALRVDDLG